MTPLLALFQAPITIPVTQGNIDYVTFVTHAIDMMMAGIGGTFTGECLFLAHAFAALILCVIFLRFGFTSTLPANEMLLGFFATYAFVIVALQHWDAPIGWLGGYNVHQLFTEEARWMAGKIDISALDELLNKFSDIANRTPRPGMMDILGAEIYLGIMINMILIEGVLFAITSFSFIALAIGIVLGPFCAVAYLWKGSRKFWYHWVDFMIKYSLYRVISSLIVFIWSHAILEFLNTYLTDYSLGTFVALFVPFGIFNLAAVYSCFKVPHLVNDFTTGSAHSGAGFGGVAVLAARGALA